MTNMWTRKTASSGQGGEARPTEKEILNHIEEIVANVTSLRSRQLQSLLDPRRNLDDDCGYPKGAIDAETYQDLYDRDPIAARVVEVFPDETWKSQPTVYEDENVENVTAFEEAWIKLGNSLRGSSYYREEEGSPIWEYLLRVDRVSGIGSYGVLLIGIDDNKELSEPAEPREGTRLIYLRAFPESLAQISVFDSDPLSPRFGQPVEYLITFNDPREQANYSGGIGITTATVAVHWTRVIHVVDNMQSSEVFGTPRMQQVLNRLLDLRKLYGGSAEMYWRGAFPGYFLKTQPQMGGEVELNKSDIKDQMEQLMNTLQRWGALEGMDLIQLAPQVVDPRPQIDVQIEAICVKLDVPKRIFLGSERGELASTQDATKWDKKIERRQRMQIIPRLIVPFVTRLIDLGCLPEPEMGFTVGWGQVTIKSDVEKAELGKILILIMAEYINKGLDVLMAPMDFLTRIMGFKEREAESIIDNARNYIEQTGLLSEMSVQQGPQGLDASGKGQVGDGEEGEGDEEEEDEEDTEGNEEE